MTQENPAYLKEQLITCIGNKRKLLSFIGQAVNEVCTGLGKRKLICIDLFSGSGVVARYLKQYSSRLIVNDLEAYSAQINQCYLSSAQLVQQSSYESAYNDLAGIIAQGKYREGFIRKLYAPQDEQNIHASDRVFYTIRNAKFIDTVRQYIDTVEESIRPLFMAPLLSEASIHSNTAGVFKGFYKDSRTGLGQFGGCQMNALSRIKGDMQLKKPVMSNFECDFEVYTQDANTLVRTMGEVDLAYIDPPYNQHPYGSNYFMLNLITSYRNPQDISPVSGIPTEWNKSQYNRKATAHDALADLIKNIKARYVLISFNSEGFISPVQMLAMLKAHGKVSVMQTPYNTYKGSRNLNLRSKHIREYLFLLKYLH